MPDDLRVPAFACTFCRAELHTASYAGVSAVSADALLGHVGAAMRGESATGDVAANAPRFRGGSADSRPAACRECRAPIAVPLDLSVRELTCGGCGRRQFVNAYIPDAERFALDMQRQRAGNDALARVRAEGVACGRCGASNAVPGDGAVQFPCASCKAPILLADHVDASAIARARLVHGMRGLRDEALRQHAARNRLIMMVAIGGVVVVALALALFGLLART